MIVGPGSHESVYERCCVPTFLIVKSAVCPLVKLGRDGPLPLLGVTTTAYGTFGHAVNAYWPWPKPDWPSATSLTDPLPVVPVFIRKVTETLALPPDMRVATDSVCETQTVPEVGKHSRSYVSVAAVLFLTVNATVYDESLNRSPSTPATGVTATGYDDPAAGTVTVTRPESLTVGDAVTVPTRWSKPPVADP